MTRRVAMRTPALMLLAAWLLVFGVAAAPADSHGLQLHITRVVVDEYPMVHAFVKVVDEVGQPVRGLTVTDFSVFVDERKVAGVLLDLRQGYRLTFEARQSSDGSAHRLTIRATVDHVSTEAALEYAMPAQQATPTTVAQVSARVASQDRRAMLRTVTARVASLTSQVVAPRVISIIAIFVTIIGTALWVVYLILAQRRGRANSYALEIANDGNVDSAYELKAEDPSSFLRFKFTLNGTDLSLAEEEPVPEVEAPVAMPVATQGAPMAAAPQAAQPAQMKGKPAKGKSGATAGAKKAGKTGGIVVNMASTIGSLLPGSAGRPFTEFAVRAREAETRARQARERQLVAKRSVESLGSQSKQVAGGGPGASAPKAAAPSPAAAATSAPVAVRPRPAGRKRGRAAQKRRPRTVRVLEWARTPVIDAGGALTINLNIATPRAPTLQSYSFKVLSRPAVDDTAPLVVEQWSAEFKRPSLLHRLLPLVVAFGGIVVVVLLALNLVINVGLIA